MTDGVAGQFLGHLLGNVPQEVLDLFDADYAVTKVYVFQSPFAFTSSYCALLRLSSDVDQQYLRVWATLDGTSFGPLQVD